MATWGPLAAGASRSVRSVQAQTEAGPPDAGAGVLLDRALRIASVEVRLTAPGGQTFTGAGLLRAWRDDSAIGWCRAPRADDDLVDGAGLASFTLPARQVGANRGRVAWLLDGVGLSGAGGNVTVDLVCTTVAGDSV